MSRLTGPSEGSRLAFRAAENGQPFTSAAGLTLTLYTASSGGSLADVQTPLGASISGSVVTIDENSLIPLLLFPDGVDTVWALPEGGSERFPLYAREDERLDSLALSIAALNSTVGIAQTGLSAEAAARASADAAELSRAQAAEAAATAAVTAETAARVAAVASEASTRAAAIVDLAAGTTAEASARASADAAEATARIAVATAGTTEQNRAIAAEASEAATRAALASLEAADHAADQLANGNEVTARIAAVAAEASRATAAEAALTATLATKQDASTAATDAELASAVSALNAAIAARLVTLTDQGVAWSTGAASVSGQVWTYQGGRYVDTTGATTLPAAPSTPRFVFLGVDTTGVGGVMLNYIENRTTRTFTDGTIANGAATLNSATAAFSSADVGRNVSGTGIPAGAKIATVIDATHATMGANATATSSTTSVTIGDFAITAVGAWTDVPGMSMTIPVTPKPVWLKFRTLLYHTVTNAAKWVQLLEVSNGVDTPLIARGYLGNSFAAGGLEDIEKEFFFASSTARVRTVKMQIQNGTAGTLAMSVPGSASITELYMAAFAR